MIIIQYRRIFYLVSAILVGASITLLVMGGLRLGIDFTGGSLLEGSFAGVRPDIQQISDALPSHVETAEVRLVGEHGVLLRMPDLSEEQHQEVIAALAAIASFQEDRFSSIGPTVGEELKRSSIMAIVVVLLVILAYVAWAFRGVAKSGSAFRYGLAALVALFHDVIILLGLFALLGWLRGVEIDTAFVAAVLATIGYSVNDTIVVFDRLRENLERSPGKHFGDTAGKSLRQTAVRSINTSVTTLIVLLAIFFLGGATIHYFVLTLAVGVIAGTYSSLFIATPLLVSWERRR